MTCSILLFNHIGADSVKSCPDTSVRSSETLTQSDSGTLYANNGSDTRPESTNVATTSSPPSDIPPPVRSISSDVCARQVSIGESYSSVSESYSAVGGSLGKHFKQIFPMCNLKFHDRSLFWLSSK